MIRILVFCRFGFLILIAAIAYAFNLGGPHWIAISATTLTVLGIVIALAQYLIPLPELSPLSPVTSDRAAFNQAFEQLQKREKEKLIATNTGTLIVWATEEYQGVNVYLLPRNEFLRARDSKEPAKEGDNNKLKKVDTITAERFGTHVLHIAIFRNLKDDRYNVWTAWGKNHPYSVIARVRSGQISELKLDWRD